MICQWQGGCAFRAQVKNTVSIPLCFLLSDSFVAKKDFNDENLDFFQVPSYLDFSRSFLKMTEICLKKTTGSFLSRHVSTILQGPPAASAVLAVLRKIPRTLLIWPGKSHAHKDSLGDGTQTCMWWSIQTTVLCVLLFKLGCWAKSNGNSSTYSGCHRTGNNVPIRFYWRRFTIA